MPINRIGILWVKRGLGALLDLQAHRWCTPAVRLLRRTSDSGQPFCIAWSKRALRVRGYRPQRTCGRSGTGFRVRRPWSIGLQIVEIGCPNRFRGLVPKIAIRITNSCVSHSIPLTDTPPISSGVLGSLARRKRWGPRKENESESETLHRHAEPQVVHPIGRVVHGSKRRPAQFGVEVIGSPSKYTTIAFVGPHRVYARLAWILAVPIGTPLEHIAVHVVQAPCIWTLLSDRYGACSRIRSVPCVLVEHDHIVPKTISRRASSAAGVLPLGLGR